jgi:aldehyde dehydrogenase (NAD+)
METGYLEGVRLAQRSWAQIPLAARVAIIRTLRKRVANNARALAETVPINVPGALHRTVADTLVAEVLPLIEACRFLERSAEEILQTRNTGRFGRPVWLGGVESRVERSPWGVVLILGASNYPLFLAGVQIIQALAAGNAVLWKTAPGTETVAFALRNLLVDSGLNPELLTLLDSGVESATSAIAAGVDHVVLTGSANTGKAVMHQLADTLTPSTMELSGCDSVFVLPGAEIARTVRAIAFGLRLNGSFTCMAPRRIFLVGMTDAEASQFEAELTSALSRLDPVSIPNKTQILLEQLINDAQIQGAELRLNGLAENTNEAGVTLILSATPSLLAMQTDIFAPILSVMRTADTGEAIAASAACGYALTAAIFGPEADARAVTSHVRAGNILINDVIVPTVDPRIPFGGRGRSGFGVTRGPEGLLAMTTPRTVQLQRGRSTRNYEPTGTGHIELFAGLAQALHGGGIRERWIGLKRLVTAARKLN